MAGGFGTRLRPLTYSQQKQLIPIANKPILFYVIEDLIEAGIKDIGIIVGPNKEQVISIVKSKKWDANIKFINQDEPLGIAHTIKISKEFLSELVLIYPVIRLSSSNSRPVPEAELAAPPLFKVTNLSLTNKSVTCS